ncbi:MAG: DNA recombination protein RmuC [Bacillota bacterium]
MEQYSILIAAGILALIAVIVAIILLRRLNCVQAEICAQQKDAQQQFIERMQHINQLMGEMIGQNQSAMAASIAAQLKQMETRIGSFETGNEQKLENMRTTIEHRLSRIQADNNERLDEMRKTVDEKLQQTLESKISQSFRIVNERLEQVYKGLGEMQTLAVGVGDLKKVLSNVKSRGIVGEIQLGAILEEILSPEQYDANVITVPGTKNYVEYAIKLPAEDGMHIYLPIDAKFPGDAYGNLQDAYESGLPEAIAAARATLCARLRQSAKDIRDKYIAPPCTTEFAIMFLPFEGLYAEAVNRGMIEQLQRDFRVSIAGPSTMAALLNSLQMGFKTVAIQRRSGEVWNLLGAVKNEFDKFGDILAAAQQRIDQANKELDKLIGTRTRSIIRKLKEVERLDDLSTTQLLGPSIDAEIDEPDEDAYNGD